MAGLPAASAWVVVGPPLLRRAVSRMAVRGSPGTKVRHTGAEVRRHARVAAESEKVEPVGVDGASTFGKLGTVGRGRVTRDQRLV